MCVRHRYDVKEAGGTFRYVLVLQAADDSLLCQECVDGSLLSSVTLRSLKLLKPFQPFGY